MAPDKNRKLEELFDRVLELDTAERELLIERECNDDEELREAIEELLRVAHSATLTSAPLWPIGLIADAPSVTLPQPGERIAQYTLLRQLGIGGMGAVFLARDDKLHREVAIKFLLAGNPAASERFLVEARTTARCRHENIVVIHDVGEHGGHPYMVLEYLEGQTLRQWLRAQKGPVAPERAIALLLPVVRALAAAHASDIIHRDLKPENILLTESGTVKVLDFGIAKMVPDVYASTLAARTASTTLSLPAGLKTQKGAILGTLPYMSPEQWVGEGIDAQSDLWAVGVILYEMVTGEHPLAPLSTARLEEVRNLDAAMPRASQARPELGALADVIDHCLAKKKQDRITRAAELCERLEQIAAPPVPRRRWIVPVAALVVLALAAVAGMLAILRARATPPAVDGGDALTALTRAADELQLWPAFSEPGGLVIVWPRGAAPAVEQAASDLYNPISKTLESRVRRQAIPPWQPDLVQRISEHARRTRTSLIAEVTGDSFLYLKVPIDSQEPDQRLEEVLSVSIVSPVTRKQVAPLLPLLAMVFADLTPERGDIAVPDPDSVGYELTTFVIFLRMQRGFDSTARDVASVASHVQTCQEAVQRDGAPKSEAVATFFCALAYYVRYGLHCPAQCNERPEVAIEWLDAIGKAWPQSTIGRAARLAVARTYAASDRDEDRDRAANLLRQWVQDERAIDSCKRLPIMEIASVLVGRSAESQAVADLQSLACPTEDASAGCTPKGIERRFPRCSPRSIANAMQHRAFYVFFNNEKWPDAARWYRGAATVDGLALSWKLPLLQDWAESELQQEPGVDAPIRREIREKLAALRECENSLGVSVKQCVQATYVSWLSATDSRADRASMGEQLCALYERVEEGDSAMGENPTLRQLDNAGSSRSRPLYDLLVAKRSRTIPAVLLSVCPGHASDQE